MIRTPRVLWAALLLALVTLVLAGAPAQAHAELESSDPADGATLDSAPAEVSFTFGEDLIDQGNAITVTEVSTGERLDLGQVEVDGERASVPWPAPADQGEYRVAFRVVSADGHPIDGSITFTIDGTAGQPPARAQASGSPTAGGSPSVRASPSVSSSPVTSSAASPAPTDPAEASQDISDAMAWMLGLGLVALLAVGGGVWHLRRRRI